MARQLPTRTLIYITGGMYKGYVRRVDIYTARRVRFYPIEDSQRSHLEDAAPTLTTAPRHIMRLAGGHPRAPPYPELTEHYPMRQAVIDLVTAYANKTDNFEITVQTLMDDILNQWAAQE
jgi:hypothetical protein